MDLNTLFNDREKLIDVLNNESDIGCVLVSVSFLDKCLTLLLQDKFIKSSKTVDKLLQPEGLLGEYSSKAKLCYCLSLIDRTKYCDLVKVAEIRNIFAHSHILLDFNNTEIQAECNKLKSCENSYLVDIIDKSSIVAKERFTHTITNIINDLMAHGYLKKIFNK
jgi:DNA-binding MltR family transcriptional regulator